MPPIELLMSVFAGVSGGLVGVLWSASVSAPWLARRLAGSPAVLRPDSAGSLFASALLFAVGGAVLGFLYWLGWGLISLVNPSWYAAGAIFGLLAWTGVTVPTLGTLALRVRDFGRIAPVLAVEWLVTCLAIGLLCARTWHRHG
jgi:hypothetical protein